jgi:lysylphosphatidylglycerol synthetase-like protein (DUF2156 family)
MRRLARVLEAALCFAVGVLLLRIASGGTFQDWRHVFAESPPLFLVEIVGAIVSVGMAVVILVGVGRRVDRAAAAWCFVSAALGLVLLMAHHESASVIVALSLIASGSVWWRTGGSRRTEH